MTIQRLLAIVLIFAIASAGWVALGGSMKVRTHSLDKSLSAEMDNLWGPKALVQAAPVCSADPRGGRDAWAPACSRVAANISHQQRFKGLMSYSTYTVEFAGVYTLAKSADGASAKPAWFMFDLPTASAYDALRVRVNDKPMSVSPAQIAEGRLAIPVDQSAEQVVTVEYATAGQDVWLYAPSQHSTGVQLAGDESTRNYCVSNTGAMACINDFELVVTTDFADIDFPTGTRSPSKKAEIFSDKAVATWKYGDAMTNQAMGVVMPCRTNAGPIVARLSFFAPVCLLFFFVALTAVVILRRLPLHPMHYLFIAAGFFAFHILLAYLVDVVNIHVAFWICAAVSVFLVVSYMRLVAGIKFALLCVGLAQAVYLVGFSYAFFWVGKTGLVIAIGAVMTLFVLMQATGRLNWHEIFDPTLRRMDYGGASNPDTRPLPYGAEE